MTPRHIRLLVTGTREDLTLQQEATVAVMMLGDSVGATMSLWVGDCPTGVDAFALDLAKRWGWAYQKFQAYWRRFGLRAGPERNGRMVAVFRKMITVSPGEARVLAFPLGYSPGTRNCISQAAAAGLSVRTIDLTAPPRRART
jgi:hypothetical protein